MANIIDYIKWRGDIPLTKRFPVNEIDSMILARFSYLIFNRIRMKNEETVASIAKKMSGFKNEEFRYNGDKELISNMGDSIRFGNLKVTDFVENNEKESEKQFGAITIHTAKDEMYISYIGTNATLYGWKEDCNMAFMDDVPCQLEGKAYLAMVAEKYPDKNIRIGGHSKGGNVAIYAAVTAEREVQGRIIKVCNYDGPGFSKKQLERFGKAAIIDRIETYFPQDSIIGRMLNHNEKCTVILSDEKGVRQHDIYSWHVLGTAPVNYGQLTRASERMNNTLTNWLENSTSEQRRVFFDSIFEILYSTEADTFAEIQQKMGKNMSLMIKGYGKMPKEDRKTVNQMLRLFVKEYASELFGGNSGNADNDSEY